MVCYAWDQVPWEAHGRCSGMPQVVSLKCLWWRKKRVCNSLFKLPCLHRWVWVQRVFLQWGEHRAVWSRVAGGAAGCDALPLLSWSDCGTGGSGCVCLHPSLPSHLKQHEVVGTIGITPCSIEVNSSFVTDSNNLVFGYNTSFLSLLLLKTLFLE